MNGVRVLRVNTAQNYTFAINVHFTGTAIHLAETILGGKGHIFATISIQL